MRRLIFGFLLVSLPLATTLVLAQSGGPTTSVSGLELGAIDRSADPCGDFYQFACGTWTARNPVPLDRSRWGRFDELQEKNNAVLRRILETAAAGQSVQSRKIGDHYASCMDESAVERKGTSPLDEHFRQIDALASAADLPELLGGLHLIGVRAFFRFGAEPDFKDAKTMIASLGQGGLGLPDRDYYVRDDPKSASIRSEYVSHVANMAALAGTPKPNAGAAADGVMRIEAALANGALDAVSRRDPASIYHKMTPAQLQTLTARFDWSRYFRSAGAPPFGAVNVSEPAFFKALDQVLASAAIDDIKAYLRWQVTRAGANFLSSALEKESFRFYGGTLQGIRELRPRWRRCVQYTDADLGEALGQSFVQETFGAQAKADMLAMVDEVESALERDIAGLPWMTDATKRQALVKLRAIENKIGYPDRWRDYSLLEIARDDFVGNVQRANAFDFRREMGRIGNPVDKSEWEMTPPTVNAYYEPLENNINFPAGILQPPFYGASTDAAVNYGAAGAVIGHELTHGFDDQGRRFDGQGNLNDWWTPEDARAFEERSACLVNEYSGFSPVEGVTLNGKLTLGENTADNGGLRLALMAYLAGAGGQAQPLDGFTPEQRLFLGWGQIWCENRRPEYERLQAQTNPHAPGRFRVNGVVSNMPEFQKAFSCRPDAPMVRRDACRVW